MDPAEAFRDRHVKAVVHEDPSWVLRIAPGGNALERLARQGRAVPPRKVLFAELNPVNARGGDGFDLLQEPLRQVWSPGRRGKTAAIRDIAQNRFARREGLLGRRRTTREGHARDLGEHR